MTGFEMVHLMQRSVPYLGITTVILAAILIRRMFVRRSTSQAARLARAGQGLDTQQFSSGSSAAMLVAVAVLGVAFLAAVLWQAWGWTRWNVEERANEQARLALTFDNTLRQYVARHVRPEMEKRVGADEFVSESMSTSFVAQSVFDGVRREFPNYLLRMPSANPRNPANLASDAERTIIRHFEEHSEATAWSGTIKLQGAEYYVRAVPRRFDASCMRCHSLPEAAPEAVVNRYGATAGFNRKIGDVSIDLVGIPVDDMMAAARTEIKRTVWGAGSLCLAFILGIAGIIHFDMHRRRRIDEGIRAQQNIQRRQSELLRHIIAHIPNHVFWKDLNSVYLGCNEQFVRTAGLTNADDIVGKTDFDLPWTRQEAEGYRQIDRNVMSAGQAIVNLEENQHTADGQQTVVVTSKVPLRDGDGRIYGVLGMYMDITERKRIESSLRTRLAAIDAAADMVVITDTKGIIQYVNPAFTATTGYSAQEVIGRSPRQLRSGDHPPSFYSDLWRTILAGEVWHGELINRRKDGTLYPEEMTITPVRDDAGSVIQFVAIKRDITRRRERDALERERRGLVEAVSAMEHVLGVVGHELRTPLAGLRAMSEFLLDEQTRGMPECDTFLRSMHDEIVRMTDTVNNLLEAARLNSGRAQWNWGRIDLVKVCREAMETVQPLVDLSRVKLIPPETSGEVSMAGDGSAIRRLLVNLLSNARKHTQSGSIAVGLNAAHEDGHEWVWITVSDTGSGIAPAIVSRLGEAFALNSGAVGIHHIEGTGLGLAICKGIAAAHGGCITVESVAGHGTVIRARLRSDLVNAVENGGNVKLITHIAA